MLSWWPCSNCIQHYQGQLTPLFISLMAKAFLVYKIHPLGCALFRNENRKSGPKSEVSVWRLELFQWKLKSVLAGNFGVSISSFEFSFPGLKEHSYLVFQTSAQSFEVRGARMNRFDCKERLVTEDSCLDVSWYNWGWGLKLLAWSSYLNHSFNNKFYNLVLLPVFR